MQKAYLFKRNTGFSTAYIGSSNLSNPALTSGLEWNIKVTEKDSFDVFKKCEATFESYWNDKEFKEYDSESEEDNRTLRLALDRSKLEVAESSVQYIFDIQPYYYQKESLRSYRLKERFMEDIRTYWWRQPGWVRRSFPPSTINDLKKAMVVKRSYYLLHTERKS
jgi:hypothetical protein